MKVLTLEVLEPYLSRKLTAPTTVSKIARFSRGASRQTWFIDIIVAGTAKKIVLRTDLATGSIDPTPLDYEYFLYERLGHSGLPIQKTLWWEDDRSLAERPFYMREHIEGSWNIDHFADPDPIYDQVRIEAAREHIRKLLLVHQTDWRAIGLGERIPVPARPEDCVPVVVGRIMELFENCRVEAIPIMPEAASWLIRHRVVPERICLCKGTNGMGEEIFRDGRIVALSDWEEASIGDPAADFAFMQGFSDEIVRDGKTLWSMQHVLDYYAEIGGLPIPLRSVHFYGTLRMLKGQIFGQTAARAVLSDPQRTDVRAGWTGIEADHIATRYIGAGLGWIAPPPASWPAENNQSVEQLPC